MRYAIEWVAILAGSGVATHAFLLLLERRRR
jgi:hypothetical protein